MISFLEKFLAAFIIVIAMGLIATALSGIVIGIVVGWAWVVNHLPGWGQWIFNIFATCTLLAFVMAIISEAEEN